MPLNDVIASFKTGTYTVTRTIGDSYVDGRLVDGGETTFPIDAVIVPGSTARSLDSATTGQETDETRQIATTTRLITRENSAKPDIVSIPDEDGVMEDWLVVSWQRSEHWGAKHFVVTVERWVYP